MKSIYTHKKIGVILFAFLSFFLLATTYAANNVSTAGLEYLELREIDKGTYNEYRYRMTEIYFKLREGFQVNKEMNKSTLMELSTLAKKAYDYLPANLANKDLHSKLEANLKNSLQNVKSDSTFNRLVISLQKYIEEVDIDKMSGSIEVTPQEGNAPLTTTLRANVVDETGTKIPSYNYVWWMMGKGGQREIIGRKTFINYTFIEEGNYSIFLGVNSNHKNAKGNTDVIPFFGKADIHVKEKVASVIVKVNSSNLGTSEELKFDRDEAKYGLLFDASSSTPSNGTKFIETQWDFGNSVEKKYNGAPKVEKVAYATNGSFPVKLTLKTNAGQEVVRNFTISINHPAASIKSNKNEGYIGDKFTFSSKTYNRGDDNINYSWEIIDINNDKIIHTKNANLFNYVFTDKGRYNVRLKITLPNGEEDVDTKIIYINSRVPSALFTTKVPKAHQPSYVLLDGSKSFDADISDDGKLTFTWIIDGERVSLEKANKNGSVGYYRFDSIGEHSIALEVTDPDSMSNLKSGNITISSLLDLDFESFPTAIQRDGTINFSAFSPNAKFYEWDFGDGIKDYGSNKNISHEYKKSGSFLVKLTVTDEDNNTNKVSKNVFVGKSHSPLALFDMTINLSEPLPYDETACGGEGAYIANKIESITFNPEKSIDLDGSNQGLAYSWKLGNNKYETLKTPSYKFDELGCFPVKLSVVSGQNGVTNSIEKYVEVVNLLPTLSSLTISSNEEDSDPIVFTIDAVGAKDPDGVIQSYLWFYYTDYDTEAQGFKTTATPQTSFVLPKITGTYYFGVVLKDNNEEKFLSEDIGRYFRTVSSDNSNTPLIELKVNDNSVSISDEVVFSAKVKNIIGKDLSGSSEYYWDFDGDGFFEKKGTSPTVSYKYKKSGTFYPKLKVKYRGLSNVRNVTVDVANRLEADFEYISVGNKFVFLDKSQGKIDNAQWDFGDDIISNTVGDVVHTYEGGARVHKVKLTIQEGTKEETIEKEVVANMKNFLKSKKTGVNLFSSPAIVEGVMGIDSEEERAIIYLGEASEKGGKEVAFYAVDYDIETDSDLNGGKDDDIDNINSPSYRNGTPLAIKFNDNKIQKVRVFTLDKDETLISAYDFTLEKKYITEEIIDLDTIVFEGITENEKKKVERLKMLLGELPSESRLNAMKFVQKLQGEWFDARGKTDVIVEMQMYLSQIPDYNPSEVNELLESFLVEDNADKGERDVAFNALKNLIPETVTCADMGDFSTCSEMLISKLEDIKISTNIDNNKKSGSEILTIIGEQSEDLMSSEAKLRFKEVLKTFVYGGVVNIPEEEREEPVIQETDSEKSLSLLKWILYIFAGVLGVLFLLLILFFLFYKFTNKDKNIEFQDFIIEKTSGNKKEKQQEDILGSVENNSDDALANLDFGDTNILKSKEKTESSTGGVTQKISTKEKETTIASNLASTKKQDNSKKTEKVPDWLGKTEKNKVDVPRKRVERQSEANSQDKETSMPSWLQGAEKKDKNIGKERAFKQEAQKTQVIKKDFKQKIEGQDTIASVNTKSEVKTIHQKQRLKQDKNKQMQQAKIPSQPISGEQHKKSQIAPEKIVQASVPKKKSMDQGMKEKEDEEKIPDWLKGTLDTPSETPKKIPVADTNTQTRVQGQSQEKQADKGVKRENSSLKSTDVNATKATHRDPEKKTIVAIGEKTDVENISTKIKKNHEKIAPTSEKKLKNNDDLEAITKIDDGIPDWLKGSFDVKDVAAEETGKKTVDVEKKQGLQKDISKAVQTGKNPITKDIKKDTTMVNASQVDQEQEKKIVIKKEKTPPEITKEAMQKTQMIEKKEPEKGTEKKIGTGALWEDGMEVPDWLKGTDDS